ncbi:MAG: nuclear transport factor 2 family protein [Bacteroidota bacterium]
MRYLVTLLLLCISLGVQAQKANSEEVMKAVHSFNKALTYRDSNTLKKILHPDLEYGHSNGWIQTKRDVIDDMYNGKLVYKNMSSGKETVTIDQNVACVRMRSDVSVKMNGKEMDFSLAVLQVWIKKNNEWLMLSRQGTKVEGTTIEK